MEGNALVEPVVRHVTFTVRSEVHVRAEALQDAYFEALERRARDRTSDNLRGLAAAGRDLAAGYEELGRAFCAAPVLLHALSLAADHLRDAATERERWADRCESDDAPRGGAQ